MYDYITISDSAEKTEVVIAYSTPKDNIRKAVFLYDKAYKRYTRKQTSTSGAETEDVITAAEFSWYYGGAVGEMASNIPKE